MRHRVEEINQPSTIKAADEVSDSPLLSLLRHCLSPTVVLSVGRVPRPTGKTVPNDRGALPAGSERVTFLSSRNAN
jgi:hypothetical protein